MSGVAHYDDSTLADAVNEIIRNSDGTRLFEYTGSIITPMEEIGIWDLNNLESYVDFVNNVAATMDITCSIGLGDYTVRLYPYRTNLEFRLTRHPIREGGSRRKEDEPVTVMRYKLIFDPAKNPPVGVSDVQMVKIEDLNLAGLADLKFQLLDRYFEPLRVKTVDGIFRDIKVDEFLKAALGWNSDQVRVDGKNVVDVIDVAEPDNKEVIKHINVPPGTRLSALPTSLQEWIGIYNGGIGTFWHRYRNKPSWFVYPLYDARRFDKAEYRAIFYAVPQEKFPQLDRSYWEDGKILKVAVTAQRMYKDTAELSMMNLGSGFRIPDARAFMKKPIELNEEAPIGKRVKLNHEVVSKSRDDGLNFAPVSATGPKANLYIEKSRVQSHSFAQIDFLWENADDELIYAGMPCKYVCLIQGKVVELKGTVLFYHMLSTRVEKRHAQAFKTMLRITIACEPQEHDPELPYTDVPGEDPHEQVS